MPVFLEGLSPCYGLSPPTPCCDPPLCAVPPLQAVSPLWFDGHGQAHAQLSPALPRSTMQHFQKVPGPPQLALLLSPEPNPTKGP